MEASEDKEKPQKEKASKAWRMEGQVKYVWVFAGKKNTCIWSQDLGFLLGYLFLNHPFPNIMRNGPIEKDSLHRLQHTETLTVNHLRI